MAQEGVHLGLGVAIVQPPLELVPEERAERLAVADALDELKGDLGNAIRPRFALADVNKDGGIDAREFEPIMKMMRGGPRRPAPEKVAAQ